MFLMKKPIKIFQLFWPAFLPVLLLNMIGIRQVYLSNIDYLDAWKGGGFGMFSKINRRFFHVHLLNRGAFECATTSPEVAGKFRRIQHYPNYLSLEQLTKSLTKRIWVYKNLDSPKKSVVMIGKNNVLTAEDAIANFDAIEIQVFDLSFNKKLFSLEPRLIRKISYLK